MKLDVYKPFELFVKANLEGLVDILRD